MKVVDDALDFETSWFDVAMTPLVIRNTFDFRYYQCSNVILNDFFSNEDFKNSKKTRNWYFFALFHVPARASERLLN